MLLRNRKWPWFAIQVRTCREKSANLLLENAGYESFLPVAKCTHRWSDRLEELDVPLFPGYVFCRMDPHDRLPVLMTPGVIQIIGTGKTAVPVEEEEIAAIQRVTKSGLPAMPWPYLRVGNLVYLAEGPLRGLSGVLVKLKFGTKIVLSVSLLLRSVAVEIDRNWIGAAHPVKPVASQAASGTLAITPANPSHLESAQDRQ